MGELVPLTNNIDAYRASTNAASQCRYGVENWNPADPDKRSEVMCEAIVSAAT